MSDLKTNLRQAERINSWCIACMVGSLALLGIAIAALTNLPK